MNERLVEDWLTKASERSFETPFAQLLLAQGMRVLRVGHSPHEHGKDVIAIDRSGKVHAYQLKDGDLDLNSFDKGIGQLTALVETQIEHPALTGNPRHQPWLVLTGQPSIPVEDRIRVHNIQWKKRRFSPLNLFVGKDLLTKFVEMARDFWPQKPEDSRSLLSLYLADGKGTLDRRAFADLIVSVTTAEKKLTRAEAARRIAAANLFASYALSPFYVAKNHWELLQGWTIAAAQIAWLADKTRLAVGVWRPTFRLAVDEARAALSALCEEASQPDALYPDGFELDQLTRSRCTICAGALGANIIIHRQRGESWKREGLAKSLIEQLFNDQRLFLWGESAVPLFLAQMWALDKLRADQFSDRILFAVVAGIAQQNSGLRTPKLPTPYESADEANAKAFGLIISGEQQMELQSSASYTLEPLVMLIARRLWRNTLSPLWSRISKIDVIRVVPDTPRDMLLWSWGHDRGKNQSRRFESPQSWRELLRMSRTDERDALPAVIQTDFDFGLMFLLTFPHRLTRPLAKHFELVISAL